MNKDKDSVSYDIFREIFEKSSAALLLIEAEGEIVMLNDSFCRISGYTKEELIGGNWITKLPTEDAVILKEYNRLRLLKDPNVPSEHEVRYYTKDGKLKYALLSASLIEQTSQTICTFMDITRRKIIEEELRVTKESYQSIVEYAGDIIFSMSHEGHFNYLSPVVQEKFGYLPEQLINVPYANYVHPDDLDHVNEHFKKVVTKGGKLNELEFRVPHMNGEWCWLSISASPVVDDEGKITAIVGVGNDVTQRKYIESALQRSEKLLWTLFNSIPDLIWLKNSDGVFVACNEAFQRSIGKPSDEIIGKTDYDIVSKEDAEAVIKMDKKVIAENKVSRNEEKLFFPGDNREVLLETIKTPIYGNEGELIGVLGIARDITDRKQMEERLSESVTFFSESQQAGSIGSYKYNFVNQTWESSEILDQILGIRPGFLKDITTWQSVIHPIDQKRIAPILRERINQKKVFDEEYRIIRLSDRETRWVHGIGKLICDDEGNNLSLIGTVQDISKRKVAEEAAFESQTKLSIALKLAHLGPWEYDVAKKQFHFNDTFYALYRTSSKKERGTSMSLDEYASKFVHPDDIQLVKREMRKANRSRKSLYISHLEHRIIYANGEVGHLAVQIARIKNRNGKGNRLFGINQDITATKRAEKKLRDSAEELRELNAMKDKFFSIIAHDLRGPFSSIIGFSELLVSQIKHNDVNNAETYAKSILGSSQLAFELLTNLLEWSRAETGKMDFNPIEINLIDIINNSIEILKPTALQKNITLKPLQNGEVIAVADSDLLSTVFRNLISNALKFTHQNGEVKVTIEKNEKECLIKVIDNGVGISQQRVLKMFRIDQNESTLGTNNENGTGLGLLLCKEFVEKHGGKIWVNSEINKGSEFCFTITLKG